MLVTGGITGIAPQNGDIIADTGALLAVTATFTVMIWGEGDSNFEIVLRNAANNADVFKQLVRYGAYAHFSQAVPITLALNERIIVRVVDYPSGRFQASMTPTRGC